MKPRHLAMGAALLVAAAFAIFGDKSPAGDVVEAAPRNAPNPASRPSTVAASPVRATTVRPADAVTVLALVPRDELMALGSSAGPGAVFNVQNWNPPPPPPPKPVPPPPPSAPPLPFVYLGKVQENGVWEVFLARGAETLNVRKDMVLDGVYRIDSVTPPTMTVTYLPLKQVQQLNIGVPE